MTTTRYQSPDENSGGTSPLPRPHGPAEVEAARALRSGGVVVIPTDTCFGLAADGFRRESVARVLKIKGRDPRRPPAVFVPNLETAVRLELFPDDLLVAASALLPGPRTLLLPAHPAAPSWLVSPEGLIGIRWITFPVVERLLSSTGLILTATSANATGMPPAYERKTLAQVLPMDKVDVVIDLPCGGLPPSEVIDLSTKVPRVRRTGGRAPDRHSHRSRIMRIGIASDHGGFALKRFLCEVLGSLGHHVEDAGTTSSDPVDYPEIAYGLAVRVGHGEFDRGIVLCGSGIGASIVANKAGGVRCALCHDPLSAELSRRHNDANMLALGGRLIGEEMARRIVEVWLTTAFEGGRHARRVGQIAALEAVAGSTT